MQTFDSLDEMWLQMAADILEHGYVGSSRDGNTRELLGWSGRLANPQACFMINPLRKASPSYAAAELLWYLSGSNRIVEQILPYAPQYERFSDDGGITTWGAYGHRWYNELNFRHQLGVYGGAESEAFCKRHGRPARPFGQLEALLWVLELTPDTRQAIMGMWNPGDLPITLRKGSNDIPCTLTMQFLLRENKLNLIVNMRSNDIWLGVPYDVWAFCNIQVMLAEALGVEVGWYQHQPGSLHCYERNWDKFVAASQPPSFSPQRLEYGAKNGPLFDAINYAVLLEKHNRENTAACKVHEGTLNDNSQLGQIVLMAASKWDDTGRICRRLENSFLARYIEANFTKG